VSESRKWFLLDMSFENDMITVYEESWKPRTHKENQNGCRLMIIKIGNCEKVKNAAEGSKDSEPYIIIIIINL